MFVFAVTQLSHGLLAHMTPARCVETGLLMMAVWWVWIYTSWITNWLDPERAGGAADAVRADGGRPGDVVVDPARPSATRGCAFAVAYVFMQVGRSLFMLWALKHHDDVNYRNFQRIIVWLARPALFWIAGALAEGWPRIVLWAVAIGIEYISPAVGMWVPGLGQSTPQTGKSTAPISPSAAPVRHHCAGPS